MTIAQTSSLQGLQRAETQLNQVATNIAQQPFTPGPQGDLVDLSSQAVALIQSKNSFEANVQALKVEDSTQQFLLNVIG
jgi:flagellar basal body rod protein FlgC